MSVTLDRLADPDQLKQVWRKLLRKDFRSLRMVELYLAQDPLYFAAHDWDIDSIVDRLASDIRDGTYRAERPVVIRAAKGLGLTRPISHLRFRDAIAYKTVVALGENAMLQSMPAWARMGRKDPKSDDDILAESGWFRAWLERQGQLWVISDKCEWLVETDISNFFPSVDAAAALAMARSDSNLER